ncbi:hypothetical protein BDV12DRAFT_205352 [Aspergillus spectabilis]
MRSDVDQVRILSGWEDLLPRNSLVGLLQLQLPLCLLCCSHPAAPVLLGPAMCLLPVPSHAVYVGGNVLTPTRVPSTLHAIGVDWDHGQWVVQLPGDVDCGRVLEDIIPQGDGICNRATFQRLHEMLGTEVGVGLPGMDPMLALATDDDLQLRDPLEDLVFHAGWGWDHNVARARNDHQDQEY